MNDSNPSPKHPRSTALTEGIRIDVVSEYIPERSDPSLPLYFFAYHITITNDGNDTVQLISRHWVIIDAQGKREEVRGPGVIGEQPTLEPGQSFRYTSACPLKTSMGSMQGSYQMKRADGTFFDAQITEFQLVEAYTLH